jgi:hypothetical protein
MDRDLFALLQEAKTWLASRPEPQLLSLEWHAHNALRLFIDVLEKDSSLLSLEMAIQTLRRHMVSKFDWSAEYCKEVSRFCSHADQIRRRMKNAGAKMSSIERQG